MTAQDKALKENTASAPLQIVAPGTCVETGEQAALVLGMYDHLVETIHQYNPSADFAQIDKAFRYADTHHNGQLRKDGSPFITHPLAVAQIIAEELRLDSESIEAALMHDCIEDTSAMYTITTCLTNSIKMIHRSLAVTIYPDTTHKIMLCRDNRYPLF